MLSGAIVQLWRNYGKKKGLDKWGYAEKFIAGVEDIHLNVGYGAEEKRKDIK